jgi:hypothetical protein
MLKGRIFPEEYSLEDFKLFRGRLEALHQEMQSWKPRRLGHLVKPGYTDRFSYYTQMFAVLIAIVGLLGLFLSVIQTAYAIISYRDSLEVARQSLEVSIQALNVSLESLKQPQGNGP